MATNLAHWIGLCTADEFGSIDGFVNTSNPKHWATLPICCFNGAMLYQAEWKLLLAGTCLTNPPRSSYSIFFSMSFFVWLSSNLTHVFGFHRPGYDMRIEDPYDTTGIASFDLANPPDNPALSWVELNWRCHYGSLYTESGFGKHPTDNWFLIFTRLVMFRFFWAEEHGFKILNGRGFSRTFEFGMEAFDLRKMHVKRDSLNETPLSFKASAETRHEQVRVLKRLEISSKLIRPFGPLEFG